MKVPTNILCTDRFREDHERFRHHLTQLKNDMEASTKCGGENVPAGLLRHFVQMLDGEMSRHAEAEEHFVYAAALHHFSKNPVVLALADEHSIIRRETQTFREVVSRSISGTAHHGELTLACLELVRILDNHMNKEDAVLFPLIEQVLGIAEMAQLSERYEAALGRGTTCAVASGPSIHQRPDVRYLGEKENQPPGRHEIHARLGRREKLIVDKGGATEASRTVNGIAVENGDSGLCGAGPPDIPPRRLLDRHAYELPHPKPDLTWRPPSLL